MRSFLLAIAAVLFCASGVNAQTPAVQLDSSKCTAGAVPVWVTNASGANGTWYCSSDRAASALPNAPGGGMLPSAGNATSAALNAIASAGGQTGGLGVTGNPTFGTGTFSGSLNSLTTGHTLSSTFATGGSAVTRNIVASTAFTNLQTASNTANNLAAGFYVGEAMTAQATTNDGGVVSTTLTVTGHSTDTTITVASATGIRSGDSIQITLDNGTLFATVVNGAPAGSVVTISPALTATATSGNAVYDYAGHIQGGIASGITTSGATNIYGIEGFEANISTRTGSNVFFKCVLCAAPNSDDAVQADGPWDMGIGLSKQTGAIGSKVGFAIGPWSGSAPVQTTGTLFKTFGTATVANGVDLSSYTITGNAWKSTGATISGAGAITGTNISISGANGTLGLIAGTTKALRVLANASLTEVAGTDQTGAGSYQPIAVGGSTVALQIGGANAVSIDASKIVTFSAAGYASCTTLKTVAGVLTCVP